ncbi:MAG: oligosaccharide flippase family protein [Colwellia sp.]
MSTKNYLYSFAQSGYGLILAFGTTAIVSRLLTPTEIGIYSLGFAFIALLNAFKNFGIQNYVVVCEELDEERIKSASLVAVLISWFLGFVILLLREKIALFYEQPALINILVVQSIAFFLWPFSAIRTGLLQRKMAFKTLFWVETISKTISSVVTLALVYYQFGAISLAFGAASWTISSFILLSIVVKSPWLFSLKHVKSCMSFGGITSIIALVALMSSQGLVLILGKMIPIEAVAQFERTQTIPILYWSYLYPAMAAVLLPSFAIILRKDKKSVARKKILTSWIYIAMVSIPVFILLGGSSHTIILILYGEQWIEAANIVYLFCIASGLSSFFIIGQSVLYAAREMSQVLIIQVLSKLVLLGIIFFSTNITLKLIGVAFIISNLVFSIIITFQVTKRLHLTRRHFKIFGAKIITFTMPFILILMAFKLIESHLMLDSISLLLAFGFTFLCCWLLLANNQGHPIINVLKNRLSKE